MKHSSLESSLRDESNGGSFISIDVIDKEPDANMPKIGILFLEILCCTDGLAAISLSIAPRDMKLPPLDSSRRDDSDELCFIFF